MTDLRLRPLTLALACDLIPLRNDPEVQTHLRNPGMVDGDQQIDWWNWIKSHRQGVRMLAVGFASDTVPVGFTENGDIVALEDFKPRLLGCAGLTSIDWQNRRAELSVYTVPATYEIEAARLILGHAFTDLGLHKIEAETLTNRRYVLCEELGFSCEGSRDHAYWRAGEFINSTRWGLLAADYSPTEPEAA